MSIELLFEDTDHLPNMMEMHPLPCVGAFKPKMKDSQKEIFANHVSNLPARSFKNFQKIFDRLRNIYDGVI